MWLITALSLAGTILNVYKKRVCFIIWVFTNATWCIHDFRIGELEQSSLFAVYFLISIWGVVKWGK